MTAEIHALILTRDEEKHIERCLTSIRPYCASLTVIDSGSTDRTQEIARRIGAEFIFNPWINYATQMNFGIAHLRDRRGWLLRIDADEYLDPSSGPKLAEVLSSVDAGIDGVLVQRRIIFMGKRIRWGGIEPSWQLRLWRTGRGACEQRWMDEHVVVQGKTTRSAIILADENLNSLDWWTSKHNHYASREAVDILVSRGLLHSRPSEALDSHLGSSQAKAKRFIKNRIYNKLPGGLRSLTYFLSRYILGGGFLDGRAGYYFHVLQGLWYRSLVDAKLSEILRIARSKKVSIEESVRVTTGIDLR
jgi:glycosyltransferase involved in cell wall biosynthesis